MPTTATLLLSTPAVSAMAMMYSVSCRANVDGLIGSRAVKDTLGNTLTAVVEDVVESLMTAAIVGGAVCSMEIDVDNTGDGDVVFGDVMIADVELSK